MRSILVTSAHLPNDEWRSFSGTVLNIISQKLFYDHCVYACARQYYSNIDDLYMEASTALKNSMKVIAQWVKTYYKDKKKILLQTSDTQQWMGPQIQIGKKPVFTDILYTLATLMERQIQKQERQYRIYEGQGDLVFPYASRMSIM